MRIIFALFIAMQLFCIVGINAFADENNFREKDNIYVVWNDIKINRINNHMVFRYEDESLEIISLDTPSKATLYIGHIEIKDFDYFFEKMSKGFDGCKLIHKEEIIFLEKNAIKYKVKCENVVGTRESILLPSLGYSISLMGNEEDFASLEDVLNHIELLPKQ